MPHGDDFMSGGTARALYERTLRDAGKGPFAVFAYGSLMWNPEFKPSFEAKARIFGYSRQPCIYSTTYRGTPRQPGLVFGLDRGGSCTGFILGIPVKGRASTVRKLFVREMFQGVYYPHVCEARREGKDMGTVKCLAFIANTISPAYAPRLPSERLREIVMSARGIRGPCVDYWRETCELLSSRGIHWAPGFSLDEG